MLPLYDLRNRASFTTNLTLFHNSGFIPYSEIQENILLVVASWAWLLFPDSSMPVKWMGSEWLKWTGSDSDTRRCNAGLTGSRIWKDGDLFDWSEIKKITRLWNGLVFSNNQKETGKNWASFRSQNHQYFMSRFWPKKCWKFFLTYGFGANVSKKCNLFNCAFVTVSISVQLLVK